MHIVRYVLQAVKEALSIPIIANGNIRDLADADACMAYTGGTIYPLKISNNTMNDSLGYVTVISNTVA